MELLAWMAQWEMLPREGGTILCALSGGRDSVCLLHYLKALSQEQAFSVAAAHFNHRMRPTAERDESFCRELCEAWGIPFYAGRGDVPALAAKNGWSHEEAARWMRYDFLEQTAQTIGAERIATAHHLSDQAETVLLNLVRGTGAEGLGGIPPVRGKIIRPLLQTSRQEIEAYLREHGLPHVEDETNRDDRFTRNRLRLHLMPELEALHPRAAAHIARTAELLRQENDYLDELAAAYLPDTGTEIPVAVLTSAPQVLQLRILRLLLARSGVGRKDFGAVHYRAIQKLAQSGGALDLPGGLRAVCRDGTLLLEKKERIPQAVTLDGEVCWGEYTISPCGDTEVVPEQECICLDREKTAHTVQVRSFCSADRLTLTEARGSRSVKRLLTERGIPPEQRQQIPVLCVGDRVAAVYGVGVDRDFLPQGGEMIKIRICKTDKACKTIVGGNNYGQEQHGSGYFEGSADRGRGEGSRAGDGRDPV